MRPDGKRVKGLTPIVSIIPYIMPQRYDAQNTVTEYIDEEVIKAYIREKRMQHARHLLRTTDLQIGTVALHCGIPDIHYFAKLFKKETGMTPGQYREHGS